MHAPKPLVTTPSQATLFSPGAMPPKKNGNKNKLQLEDRAVHDWYRFVLSYPPHLVRDYLGRFGVTEKDWVLDPFCGTGTTLVECKKLGIPTVGVEAHPLAAFASRTKLDWKLDAAALLRHATSIAAGAREELARQGINDQSMLSGPKSGQQLRQLQPDEAKLLLTGSISPLPLHKVLVLLSHITARPGRYTEHHRLALARALVTTISNLEFGPEVGVGPAKPDAPVIPAWLAENVRISEDLRAVRTRSQSPAVVYHADSRSSLLALPPASVSAVITSPPYPNEKDYTRTTRLESVLLGFLHNKADLRALKQGLVRSNTRNVYKQDDEDCWVRDNSEIQRIADEIEHRRIELGKTSGFERMYPRVTRLYFGGMARHLAHLRDVLRPGAHLAYVVGDQASYLRVMIRTGQLLGEIAESLGYRVESLDLFRTRLATATRVQLREEVLVLSWPGKSGQLSISERGARQ